ncbi:MAG: AAA family ATPase [Patescibacteria group bacterium]
MIISVVNQKGGTGKTTTVVNLVSYIAHLGRRVLLVDLDPQANATSGFGLNPREVQAGIYELMGATVEPQTVIKEIRANLYLLPTNENLAGANIELVDTENREFKLSEALRKISNNYDYIIIDTPPSLGLLTINSLLAADALLIPVQAEYYALEGLGQLMNTVELVKNNLKPELDILGAVVTMYDERSRLSREVWEEMYKNFGSRIFRTIIPRNVKLAEAPSFGQSILEYDPRSKGAKAYQRLAREFISLSNQIKSINS